MTTVKEFKDFGVEFVEDDRFIDDSGCVYSGISHSLNNGSNSWDSDRVMLFVWRASARPANPKFKYEKWASPFAWRPLLDQSQTETLKEAEVFNKMKPYDFDAHVSDGRIGVMSNGDEVELVAANDDKPVFTQAMADAGELPPVGSEAEYLTAYFTNEKQNKGVCTVIAIHNGRVWIDIVGSVDAFMGVEMISFKPIDTRTPKQKAVDELSKDIKDLCCMNGDPQRNAVAVCLVNLGYKKC